MHKASIQDQRRDELREVIASSGRRPIFVVGAGVSFGATRRTEALWSGLLSHGIEYCLKVVSGLGADFRDRHEKAVATGDLDELLGVARIITRKLGDRKDPRYRNWLLEAVGSLRPEHPEVIQALAALELPIATTNYDTLLEQATGRPSVTWRRPGDMLRFLKSGGSAIGHLHGLFSEPESVVLDEHSYLEVIGSDAAQTLQRGIALFHSLIFVGCGAGLADPNFAGLLRWLRQHFPDSDHRHYRLCRDGEVEKLERDHAGDRIAVVSYGADHAELESFLRGLEPARMAPAAVITPASTPPSTAAPTHLDAYRAWALESSGHLEMIGVGAAELKLELSKVYVPLRLEDGRERSAEGADDLAKERLGRQTEDLDLLELFRTLPPPTPFAVILGEAGAGKTTALRKLLFHVLEVGPESLGLAPGTVPVLLRLRRLAAADVEAEGKGTRLTLGAFIDRELAERAGANAFSGLGEQLWKRGNLLLLLDGLDEVADDSLRAFISRYLDWELQGQERRGVRAVVSCRRASYGDKAKLGERFKVVEVRPLGAQEGADLVRSWFREASRLVPSYTPQVMQEKAEALVTTLASPTYAVQRIQRLVGSPLLLTLLCVVVLRGREIPRRRTAFYQQCLEVLLHQWGKSQGRVEPVLPLETALAVLSPLAYKLHQENRRDDLTVTELRAFLKRRLKALGRPEKPAEVIRWLVQETGVLVAAPPKYFAFAHLGVQEYLTALNLANDSEVLIPRLRPVAEQSWWREVIELLAGLSGPKVFSMLAKTLLDSPALLSEPGLLAACIEEAEEVDLAPFLDLLEPEVPAERQAAVLKLVGGRRDGELLEHCRELAAQTGVLETAGREVAALAARILSEAERHRAGIAELRSEVLLLASAADEAASDWLAQQLESRGMGTRRLRVEGEWHEEVDQIEEQTRVAVLLLGPTGHRPWDGREVPALLEILAAEGCSFVLASLEGAPPLDALTAELPSQTKRVQLGSAAPISELLQVLAEPAAGQELVVPAGRAIPGQPFVDELTGVCFLWVAPGRFRMGEAGRPQGAGRDEWVEAGGFWLAETPVTNRQYGLFVEATSYREPLYWRDKRVSLPEQPVVGVSWDDAVAFCQWVGNRIALPVVLPTEVQWEYTARGPESWRYPWGDEDPDASRACFGLDFSKGAPSVVGSYPAGRGPFGHLDLAGNVWEWCENEVDLPEVKGVWEKGEVGRVLKGGGWDGPAVFLRSAIRNGYHAWIRNQVIGFRLAVSPPSR